jgi:hypothetical protein
MLIQYGNNCLAQRKVYELVELLRNGRTSAWTTTWQATYLEGPILKICQAKGETVTCECYCAFLTDELKPDICSKQRGQLSQFVILQHNNAPSAYC